MRLVAAASSRCHCHYPLFPSSHEPSFSFVALALLSGTRPSAFSLTLSPFTYPAQYMAPERFGIGPTAAQSGGGGGGADSDSDSSGGEGGEEKKEERAEAGMKESIRSDVWGLGCIVAEVATHCLPFPPPLFLLLLPPLPPAKSLLVFARRHSVVSLALPSAQLFGAPPPFANKTIQQIQVELVNRKPPYSARHAKLPSHPAYQASGRDHSLFSFAPFRRFLSKQ